jgi:hypothetical protein
MFTLVSSAANSYGAFVVQLEHAIPVDRSDGSGLIFKIARPAWIELPSTPSCPEWPICPFVHYGQRPSWRRAQSARAFSLRMQTNRGICGQDLITRDAHLHDALLAESQTLQDIVLSEVSRQRSVRRKKLTLAITLATTVRPRAYHQRWIQSLGRVLEQGRL